NGWTTAEKMAASTWKDRTIVLNQAGYARYDESTSRYLGKTAQELLDDYGGDLRRLREAADRDPAREHRRLTSFKGIGKVGADIFLREVQVAWTEIYPFADSKVMTSAGRLGLGDDADELAKLVPRKHFARLAAALVRVDLAKAHDDIRREVRDAA
ncbi:MAG: hypothetical protein KKB37_15455, partial [Alphaproteobacteria bacterium]|nr:hypothetical protein [Alphaproteobacteria bacterium]